MTQLEHIYKDEKRIRDFKTGMRYGLKCAAELADSWEGNHEKRRFRLGDLILFKFGIRKRTRKAIHELRRKEGEGNG